MQQGFGQVVDMDGFSLVGTMAFAFSGYLVGARKHLDLLGLVILSLLTAVGGGMVRDALIGDPPRVFFDNTAPLVALGTLTVAWLFGLHRKESRLINRLFIVSDSIGLVAFSLAGAQIGIDMGMSLFGVVTLGFVTAIGGGIVRDVLVNDVPFILSTDFYGIVSLLVGAGLWGLAELGWHDAWLVQGLFALGLLIRLVAHRRALRLPTVNSI
ncbi:TRIC cation channel family protein [Laribacter hongkongensis]|uniref:trimeric intracellular cation channel family protein n=1 Tax=Laribacter hongkongensis TaxID=168471 RepID=UPI001EFEB2FC|nr:TRIC cation channel family protein [Laribacter hongkongensis]MCG8994740.1 TRIC cation channel family protein [Laribacter hongkongensis]MCG9009523.1 TRIC cation channel family protein [Laribacter hongkongensis]MCG9021576.1 TRIC cation channel family protein [Laribacter hongkongensis]MCG9045809.1 TRIC cation channel family protein [Laribacter hongkongensis]MCG9072758.1 TRIC cation channel family protein [Laribacter hongkongensis]